MRPTIPVVCCISPLRLRYFKANMSRQVKTELGLTSRANRHHCKTNTFKLRAATLSPLSLMSFNFSTNVASLEAQTDLTPFVCDACRRSFVGGGALNYHTRTCRATKKRTGNALEKVREAWQQARETKKRRINVSSFTADPRSPHEVCTQRPYPCRLIYVDFHPWHW